MISPDRPEAEPPARDVAAEWSRRRAAGLSAAERESLQRWLAADRRHRLALASVEGSDELDWALYTGNTTRVARGVERLRQRRQARRWAWSVVAACAAVVAVSVYFPWSRRAEVPAVARMAIVTPERQTLPDGSTVELGEGARIAVEFLPGGRRGVRLVRGTAHFEVARDPARPFVVEVGGVQVRAVGTAFSVALDAAEVNVVVTHGRVSVDEAVPASGDTVAELTTEPVGAGNLIVVPAGAGRLPDAAEVSVRPLDEAGMLAAQAWRATRLELSGTPLAEVVAAMNRYGGVRITLADAALASVRLSGSIRTDKADKLVRILEADFGVQAEWVSAGEVRLRLSSGAR